MTTVCHGAFNNIQYDRMNDYPSTLIYPGEVIQNAFWPNHPLSIGTNPVDALFRWLRSQPEVPDLASDGTSPLTPDQVKRILMRLQTLVLDFNDDIDSQLNTEGLLATNNFIPSSAGMQWHIKASGNQVPKQPAVPSAANIDSWMNLNAKKALLNALLLETNQWKMELFAEWWTYVSASSAERLNLKPTITGRVTNLRMFINQENAPAIAQLSSDIAKLTDSLSAQLGTEAPFIFKMIQHSLWLAYRQSGPGQ